MCGQNLFTSAIEFLQIQQTEDYSPIFKPYDSPPEFPQSEEEKIPKIVEK